MQPFPHVYTVSARGPAGGALTLTADGAPSLLSAAPREFDGPGDQWSPESLLMAAAASCFILTFRAVARASRLEWASLECTVEGTLERIEGVTRFTRLLTKSRLTIPMTANKELCQRALEKAEHGCLVSSSLNAVRELQTEVIVA